MAQYYPAGLVGKPGRHSYEELDRHLDGAEYERAALLAEALGLQRLDRRSLASGMLLAGM
jgi:putative pyruvate formate lyase activating enzyme